MKWGSPRPEYKRQFLWFPRCVEGTWYWLVWCWTDFCGDCTEFHFEEPKCSHCGGGNVYCNRCMRWRKKA